MAKNGSKKGLYAIGVVILVIVAAYVLAPDAFTGLTVGGPGGVQTSPPGGDIGAQTYEGPVTMNTNHRNSLDSAEQRIEGTNLVTNYFKLVNGVYKSIGSGSGNTINIDATTNQIFAGVQVPVGQTFYVAPSSTADSDLNPRIRGFDFFDVTGDGQKEWVFTVDMTNLRIQGGQTSPTIDLNIDSFNSAAPLHVNNPVDQVVTTSSGNRVFIEWDLANNPAISSAYPVYEIELKVNSTQTAKWDRGQSELVVPNLGTLSLGDMERQLSGADTIYTTTGGFTLKEANFVTIPQNTQNKTDWDLKFVTNFGATEAYDITLTIRYITPSLGSNEVSDVVVLSTT